MKYQFSIQIEGEDSIKEKIEEAVKSHPKIHIELIKSFIQAIMLTFHFDETDNISVKQFGAGRIEDSKDKSTNESNG
jgi:hypothetical protein